MEWRLLSVLSDDERRTVMSIARRRHFVRGETVFHEGDPGDTMHLIESGHVALRVTTPMGDVATLTVLGPGDYFGELAIVSPAARNATVIALEPVDTLSLHRDQFNELRSRHPAVDRVVLEALVGEVRRLSHRLLEALYVPADKRVLRRLIELARLYSEGSGPITVPLTQEDLAELAGTTRPTTNKVLRRAEEAGHVEINRGRIVITNPSALTRRAT